ncbi:MAG: hypothetical protein ACR2N9_03590 [Acidimicrobiia bacterium]
MIDLLDAAWFEVVWLDIGSSVTIVSERVRMVADPVSDPREG